MIVTHPTDTAVQAETIDKRTIRITRTGDEPFELIISKKEVFRVIEWAVNNKNSDAEYEWLYPLFKG